MTPEYKAEKLASVTDLQGGGLWEINIITFLAPVAAFVWAVLQTRQSFFKPYTATAYFADFVLQCCTILFSTTVYADSPQTLMGLLLLPAIATYLQPKTEVKAEPKSEVKLDDNGKPVDDTDVTKDEADRDPLPVKPFITSYRGAMMIVTCTSILAVDFQIFPRRFAKTENFGKSLMDLGVGSFVFAAGIVAARQQLKEQYAQVSRSFLTRMRTSLRHAIPLFILGLIRLASVKSLDYTEHVSEYGVHWNFFFTLALLSPTIALLQPLLNIMPSTGLLAFIIAIAYELILFMTPDMKAWLLLSPRIPGDFLSQNREGIFSFIGYLAIFIAGMGVGQGILPRDEEPTTDTALQQAKKTLAAQKEKDSMDEDAEWLASVLGQPINPDGTSAEKEIKPFHPAEAIQTFRALPRLAIFHLIKWTFLWSLFSTWAMWRYGPRLTVSRRMANLPYICWVCAFNSAQLLVFCGIEMLMFPDVHRSRDFAVEKERMKSATSKVLHAFNRNGLVLFLLANLGTGAVNLGVETWRVGDVGAVAILIGYIGAIAGVGLVLDYYDISAKL